MTFCQLSGCFSLTRKIILSYTYPRKIKKEGVMPIGEGKGHIMKKMRIYLLASMLLLVCLPAAHAEEYGKIRAMQQRAAHVIQQKNDFVGRVLTSYSIPHERNAQGVVVRIKMNGQWLDITAIDIVPVLKEGEDKRQQVAAHELFFYTPHDILDLVSELTIR